MAHAIIFVAGIVCLASRHWVLGALCLIVALAAAT